MADLKTIFGVDVSSFVDFIQDDTDEESVDSKKHEHQSTFLRKHIQPGDDIHSKSGSGAVGILLGDLYKEHYATTCYHVCYGKKLPEEDIDKGHRMLLEDFQNNSKDCDIDYLHAFKQKNDMALLGKFFRGLYNDEHDIALIKLEETFNNCFDTVKLLRQEDIRPVLADKKEVSELLHKSVTGLTVVIIRPQRGERKFGNLFALTTVGKHKPYRRCYKIKGNDERPFATEGDSGSLVYLIYEGRRIPFAYLCFVDPESKKNVYYCRNLIHSIEELKKHHHLLGSACLSECSNNQKKEHDKAQ